MNFRPLDEPAAREMMRWRYPAPYNIYDLAVPEAETEEMVRFLLDPANNYYRIDDDQGEMVAFCCFGRDAQVPGGDYARSALDIGLGVRPDLTGQGRGSSFAGEVIEFGKRTYNPERLRVTIAAFNNRAQRVWEKAGFKRVQTFTRPGSQYQFVVLERKA